MELLGQSLENLFQAQNKSFSIKTACMLGIQMIDRIEYVHSRKIIHRDIKPDNFVMGRGLKSHIVYILDFGLSKKYWSVSHRCHLPFIKGKKLTGTARYLANLVRKNIDTKTRSNERLSIAASIAYVINGLPFSSLMFLSFRPLDPLLAGMIAILRICFTSLFIILLYSP